MGAHTPALAVGLLLALILLLLIWHGQRLERLERERMTRDQRAAMLRRIHFLEGEIRKIRGSIPFQIFDNGHRRTG